jgi:putative transposase
MPWKDDPVIEQRVKFVREYDRYVRSGEKSMSELCAEHDISRKTGYKMLGRRDEGGFPGLKDRSRAPLSGPHWSDEELVMRVLETRLEFPHWGAATIIWHLRRSDPDRTWPGPSAVHAWISKAGLVVPSRRARRFRHPGPPPSIPIDRANQQVSTDFKGHFRTGDGRYCYALTIVDSFSRSLLACEALTSTSFESVWPVFERVFREYGLPESILSDNGTPFASCSVKRLSKLSVRWIRLSIEPRLIQPGKPQQNGIHERIHEHMKPLVCSNPSGNAAEQQKQFDWFIDHHNNVRPNAACGGRTPSDLYTPSPRPYPAKLPVIEYPSDFQVRRVRSSGEIQWKGQSFFVSDALVGEPVGFQFVDDGYWVMYFSSLDLGYYSSREKKLYLDRTRPDGEAENA